MTVHRASVHNPISEALYANRARLLLLNIPIIDLP